MFLILFVSIYKLNKVQFLSQKQKYFSVEDQLLPGHKNDFLQSEENVNLNNHPIHQSPYSIKCWNLLRLTFSSDLMKPCLWPSKSLSSIEKYFCFEKEIKLFSAYKNKSPFKPFTTGEEVMLLFMQSCKTPKKSLSEDKTGNEEKQ